MKKHIFKVKEKNDKQRLDVFLSSVMKDSSRSFVQKQIKKNKVIVNDAVVKKPSFNVSKGDCIEVSFVKGEKERISIKPVKMPIDIVFKNQYLVVVNKEHGICVHPAVGNWDNTLINGLMYRFKKLKNVGSGYKLGLIHRIDKDTSGLVLIALTNKALWFFSRQFEQREVKKTYLAILKGDVRKVFDGREKLQVSNYLGRNPRNRKKMAVVQKEKGRLATTDIFHIKTVNDAKLGIISLVKAMPKTGRTHQIRVHLANLGFPVVGDTIYGKGNKYKRMMLHACKIVLRMINGRAKTFLAKIPPEFYEIMNIDSNL